MKNMDIDEWQTHWGGFVQAHDRSLENYRLISQKYIKVIKVGPRVSRVESAAFIVASILLLGIAATPKTSFEIPLAVLAMGLVVFSFKGTLFTKERLKKARLQCVLDCYDEDMANELGTRPAIWYSYLSEPQKYSYTDTESERFKPLGFEIWLENRLTESEREIAAALATDYQGTMLELIETARNV